MHKPQHTSNCMCGWCKDMRQQAEFVRTHLRGPNCHCGICFDERAQQEWQKAHPDQKPDADGSLPQPVERMD